MEELLFRRAVTTPKTYTEHAIIVRDFLEDLEEYSKLLWDEYCSEKGQEYQGIYNEYLKRLDKERTSIQASSEFNANARTDAQYKKAGIYGIELEQKINLTSHMSSKLSSWWRRNKDANAKKEEELDKKVNKSLLDWLINLIKSLMKRFNIGHHVIEMLSVFKIFVDGVIFG